MKEITKISDIVGENSFLQSEKIEFFEHLLINTNRTGVDKVIDFLRKTDFYYAPASASHSGNYRGGLLDHSLIVYLIAKSYNNALISISDDFRDKIDMVSLTLCSLLHDICSTCLYKEETKWKKGETNQWESYIGYGINDTVPWGHGAKSVIMLQQLGLDLVSAEICAILYHMGFWETDAKDTRFSQMNAIKYFPIVTLIQTANFESSVIFEKEKV